MRKQGVTVKRSNGNGEGKLGEVGVVWVLRVLRVLRVGAVPSDTYVFMTGVRITGTYNLTGIGVPVIISNEALTYFMNYVWVY